MNSAGLLSTHTISIAGMQYTIRTNEPATVIEHAQQLIHTHLEQCKDQPLGQANRLAFIVLNIAIEYVKMQKHAENTDSRDEQILRAIDTILGTVHEK